MDIFTAMKKAFETGGNAATFTYEGAWYTVHNDMTAYEVLEILTMEVPMTEFQFDLVRKSAEKLIEKNQETQASEERFKSLSEQIKHELETYEMNQK